MKWNHSIIWNWIKVANNHPVNIQPYYWLRAQIVIRLTCAKVPRAHHYTVYKCFLQIGSPITSCATPLLLLILYILPYNATTRCLHYTQHLLNIHLAYLLHLLLQEGKNFAIWERLKYRAPPLKWFSSLSFLTYSQTHPTVS